MKYNIPCKPLFAGAMSLLFLMGAQSPTVAQDWPTSAITLMASTPPGGGIDRWSRLLAPYLSEEIGAPVVVENVPGGQGILSADRLLRSGGQGNLLLAATISQMITHIEAKRVSFGLDDFDFLNSPAEEYPFLIATPESPYDTAEDLVKALTEGVDIPTLAGTSGSGPGIVTNIFLGKLNVTQANYREVSYGGGGPLIVAYQGSQVDFGPLPARLLSQVEGAKPLLVFSHERDENHPDVPTVNEVLEKHGEPMPIMNTGLRALAVSASFRENHPDRYEILLNALERVYAREDAIAEFDKGDVGSRWLGPDKTSEEVHTFQREFGEYHGE